MQIYKHYSDFPTDQWRWPNFSPQEMASKGEGELGIDPDAMDKLQALRARLGKPILITSAYRSEAHNRSVGGATNSYHKRAQAFDCRMENQNPQVFEAAAREVGFTGFGFYPKSGFMHVDTGPARQWGTRFKQADSGLPMEPTTTPERLRDDGVGKAGGAAVVSGGIGAIAETVQAVAPAGSMIGDLAPIAQTVAVVAVILLGAYIVWRRF